MARGVEREGRPESPARNPFPFASVFLLAAITWTLVLAGLCAWSIQTVLTHTRKLAHHQARAFFQEIVTTRAWNATHGGVYVPVTETTQPNAYLEDPRRDLVTADGLRLTKINPAFMTRQIAEIASDKNLVLFHISSLEPIRPANAADAWEAAALRSFAKGAPERGTFVDDERGRTVYRYMAPLWVESACLRCHAKQGYREGDLRGGISVTVRADGILGLRSRELRNLSAAYGFLWIFGLAGILVAHRSLVREERKRQGVIVELEGALNEVKKLSGLLPICASCKKIRDDQGYWSHVETYIQTHSEADFSHSICPECLQRLYPEFAARRKLEEGREAPTHQGASDGDPELGGSAGPGQGDAG